MLTMASIAITGRLWHRILVIKNNVKLSCFKTHPNVSQTNWMAIDLNISNLKEKTI